VKLSITPNAIAVVLAIVMVSALSPANADGRTGPGVRRSVQGVWTVTTTPRNCTTGAPIPGAESEGLFTFHRDGTMSAWLQNSFITVTRSPSQGLWQRDRGWRDYSFGFIHLRYDISGFFIGKQTAAGSLALNESGDQFTTDSSTALFDASGLPLGGGCASSVGTRFDLGS
jgi:hypothetical protein